MNPKEAARLKRKKRIKKKLGGGERFRLSVFRSCKHIYAQIIDDEKGATLVAASSLEKDLGFVGKNNLEAAAKVGAALAERATKAGFEVCYFDRGGFLFHGKIKALADAAREGGLKF